MELYVVWMDYRIESSVNREHISYNFIRSDMFFLIQFSTQMMDSNIESVRLISDQFANVKLVKYVEKDNYRKMQS